jgi:hypothetical protein
MKLLLTSLAILAALAACDRIAAWQADHLIAQRLQQSYRLPQTPSVQVQGVPFLSQWASGRYQEIDVQMDQLSVQGVKVDHVAVRLEQVTTPQFVTSAQAMVGARAGTASVAGVVPYASLPLPSGLQLAPEPGGRLRLQGSLGVGLVTTSIGADLQVTVQDGAIGVNLVDVRTTDPLLRAQASSLLRSALATVNGLRPSLLGMQLQSVQVRQDGLAISALGQHVPLAPVQG